MHGRLDDAVRRELPRGAGGAWACGALLLAAAVLPLLFASGYRLFQLTMVVVYAVAILGLNVVTGITGQISLGHGAFFALGATVTAVLITSAGAPYWATLPAATAVCGAAGFLVGFPALRLGGLYLALTTFALAVATPQILKSPALEPWTGGGQGLVIDKPDPPAGLGLDADQFLYLFTLGVGAGLFLLAHNLLRGRIGRAMRAIRDQPVAAAAMGVDIAVVKTGSFAAGAALTGLAGSLGAIAVQFVAPDGFGIFLSLTLFVGLVVGGVGVIEGALFGAVFIEFVPNVTESVSKAAPGAIYGVILIAVMFLMPSGVAGVLRAVGTRLAIRAGGGSARQH